MAATTPPKARKKASAPRKATKRVASSNGHNGVAPAISEPTESGSKPAAVPELQHPYGKLPVYVFKPSTGDSIVFPKIHTVEVSAKFMWTIYDLAEIFQSFEWMKLAKVPRAMQERVVDLPIAERQLFWSGWFNDVTQPMDLSADSMGPPGES